MLQLPGTNLEAKGIRYEDFRWIWIAHNSQVSIGIYDDGNRIIIAKSIAHIQLDLPIDSLIPDWSTITNPQISVRLGRAEKRIPCIRHSIAIGVEDVLIAYRILGLVPNRSAVK